MAGPYIGPEGIEKMVAEGGNYAEVLDALITVQREEIVVLCETINEMGGTIVALEEEKDKWRAAYEKEKGDI